MQYLFVTNVKSFHGLFVWTIAKSCVYQTSILLCLLPLTIYIYEVTVRVDIQYIQYGARMLLIVLPGIGAGYIRIYI